MATPKECTVFIVDLGQSMGKKRHGRDISDLDWSMQYVWDKIATIVSAGRKTLFAGVLGLRTNETTHNGPKEEEYEHLAVLKYPSQLSMPDIRELQDKIRPSSTDNGDAISAIIVAIQLLQSHAEKNKFRKGKDIKKIILVTNSDGTVDADELEAIAAKLRDDDIGLTILGVDLDDLEYGFKEEDKSEVKERNEKTLKQLTNHCDGMIGTLQQATQELKIPNPKIPRSTPTFKGKLTLGDSGTYESAMEIDVERYAKIMPGRTPAPKKVTVKSQEATDTVAALVDLPSREQANGDTSLVQNTRAYQVKDESTPSGKRDVDRNDLAKGYEYGRETVYIDEADENATKLETVAGLDIIGFVPRENISRYMDMSKCNVIIAQRTNDLAAMALSSFIHTLFELDTCTIARLVSKDERPPVILALTASIDNDFECLLDNELPFAEDFRQHKFPPLDRIPTLSGKVLTEHRHLPSQDLVGAMSAYVDSMDLSKADKDEDGEQTDYLKLEESWNPKSNGVTQAIRHRAIHPNDPPPAPNDVLIRFSHPPEQVLKQAKTKLDRVREIADVKKVPPKSLSRRNYRGKKKDEAPRSGLDVMALLSERSANNKHNISAQNAVPEFKQIVAGAEDIETIHEAVAQFGEIIQNWIKQSMGDSNYGRAIEGIGVMRQECIELEEVGSFHEFMRDLKDKVFEEELGGDRREFWWQLRTNNMGLVDKKTAGDQGVEEDESRQFMIPDRTRA